MQAAQRGRAWLAYHVAGLSRMKRLPRLEELTGERRRVQKQSLDEMAGVLRGYKAASAANRRIRGES